MKKYVIVGLVIYWGLMIFMHASANEPKDVVKKIAVGYAKEIINPYIDFNNDFIKYGGGALLVLKDKEVDFNITENTNINIQEDSINIVFKKEF